MTGTRQSGDNQRSDSVDLVWASRWERRKLSSLTRANSATHSWIIHLNSSARSSAHSTQRYILFQANCSSLWLSRLEPSDSTKGQKQTEPLSLSLKHAHVKSVLTAPLFGPFRQPGRPLRSAPLFLVLAVGRPRIALAAGRGQADS